MQISESMTALSKSVKFALIRRVCATLLFVFAAAGALNAQTTQTFDGIGNLVAAGYALNPNTGADYYVVRHLNNGGATDGSSIGERVFDGDYQGNG